MLPRRERLSTEEFNEVIKNGRVIHSPLFLMRVVKNAPSTKFAAVASKKVAKTAVLRNRIQRKIYEAIGKHIRKVFPGSRGILLAKEAALSTTVEVISADIRDLFVKVGILK